MSYLYIIMMKSPSTEIHLNVVVLIIKVFKQNKKNICDITLF